jgi:hypothetical protein
MDGFLDDIARAYDREIQLPGKELAFLILVSFLLSFGFIRGSAHMIRAQVSWWPGNVETKGGTHIHHMVWGILLMMIFGYVGIAIADSTPWIEIAAILFGIGMGLTLDEFALWLNLKDVYWSAKGRQSIDAVIIAATLVGITILGVQFLVEVAKSGLVLFGYGGERLSGDESASVLLPWQALGVLLATLCFFKGKVITGLVGLALPIVALVGAIRLAKPGSIWAKRYGPKKAAKSHARFKAEEESYRRQAAEIAGEAGAGETAAAKS